MSNRRRPIVASLLTVLTALGALLPAGGAAAREPSGAPPEVLPALRQWQGAPGEFRLADRARIVLEGAGARTRADAHRFAGELAERSGTRPAVAHGPARTGDLVLRERPPLKGELGAEGYRLESGERLTVTAATATGLFYGTRTALQLLGDRTAPRGSATDVPSYRERGVGVCACYIHVSMEWFERLLRDMAYQKLNQLWIEAKVKSDTDPASAFWGYYTKPEVRRLVALAKRYHVELVPEINSPGHMDPYLENHPELQLKDKNGKASPPRLDITRPEAFAYYTSLVDEALAVWDSRSWHMGADEYMLGSAYPDYPQLQAYATEKFGPEATPDDVFTDFVNRVDAHVRAKGRSLRIWNDGLQGANAVVPLNPGITVEHWLGGGATEKPSALLAEGRRVMNSAYALYLVRGGFTMNTRQLYESDWTPLRFEGETLTARPAGLTGAKISLWPDNFAAETENEVEAKAFLPLRFLAQATWGGPKPAPTYAGFQALAERLGHAPGWQNADRTPVPDGTYELRADDGARLAPGAGGLAAFTRSGSATWTLTATSDGYYTVRAAQGAGCLEDRRGRLHGGAPLEAGSELTVEPCAASARTQRWQLTDTGGGRLVVRNAVSQLQLSERAADSVAMQTAPDVTAPARLRAVAVRD